MSTIATVESGSAVRSERHYCLPSLHAAVVPSWSSTVDQAGEFPLHVGLTSGPIKTDWLNSCDELTLSLKL